VELELLLGCCRRQCYCYIQRRSVDSASVQGYLVQRVSVNKRGVQVDGFMSSLLYLRTLRDSNVASVKEGMAPR
jgi:hypothetical protein